MISVLAGMKWRAFICMAQVLEIKWGPTVLHSFMIKVLPYIRSLKPPPLFLLAIYRLNKNI